MNHSWPERILALVHLGGIIGSSEWGLDSDDEPMIVIVSSFWWEMRKEIQSTQAHVVFFHVQNKMAPVDSWKQKLGILNHIIRKCQRRKRIQQCIINMLKVRRRIIMNVCLLSLLILSRARNNAARIAPARKQRSCRRFPRNQGWWENVWRNYSEKRFK